MVRKVVTHFVPREEWPAPEQKRHNSLIPPISADVEGGKAYFEIERQDTEETVLKIRFHLREGASQTLSTFAGMPTRVDREIWSVEATERSSLVGLERQGVHCRSDGRIINIFPILPAPEENGEWRALLQKLYEEVCEQKGIHAAVGEFVKESL